MTTRGRRAEDCASGRTDTSAGRRAFLRFRHICAAGDRNRTRDHDHEDLRRSVDFHPCLPFRLLCWILAQRPEHAKGRHARQK
jgi:hypothetical protein